MGAAGVRFATRSGAVANSDCGRLHSEQAGAAERLSMRQSANAAARQIAGLLRADDGLEMIVGDLLVDDEQGAPPIEIVELNAPPELTEKASHVKYPAVYVYCERITNSLKEK